MGNHSGLVRAAAAPPAITVGASVTVGTVSCWRKERVVPPLTVASPEALVVAP